jgi:transposase-like protein
MSNLTSVLSQAKALSEQEQEELLTQLEEYLVLGSQITQVTKEVKEMRFSKGRVCCHCVDTDVVRNGKNKGVQRYLCRTCHRSFFDLTNSATYKSKKSLDKWLRYAKWLFYKKIC